MELSDLRIFRAVVEAGGVRAAAAQLHRVQSNVTTRVRQLEQELGVDLFIREGKRLRVSPAGTVLMEYAERLLALADEARDALNEQAPRGLLRLGAMESTAAVRLPGPLSEYHRRYPDVVLELRTGNPRQLSTAVLAGELDAALVADPASGRALAKLPLYDEELVIVAAADHPPIKSARDISNGTILAFEPGCPHRKRLEDWFSRSRHVPQRIVEISSYHALLGCAVVGMGAALMPRSVIDSFPESHRLSVHPLSGPPSRATTVLVWHSRAQTPKIRSLAETLLAHRSIAGKRKRRKTR